MAASPARANPVFARTVSPSIDGDFPTVLPFSPDVGGAHRIVSPAYTPRDPEAWRRATEEARESPPRVVPVAHRESYQRDTPLIEFVRQCEAGVLEPIGGANKSHETVAKDRLAVSRFVAVTQPEWWRADEHGDWPGPPCSIITTALVRKAVERMRLRWADGTVASTVTHLRTVLNHAFRVGALPSKVDITTVDADTTTRTLPLHRLGDVLGAVADHEGLFVGVLLGLAAGLRSVDKWTLTWSQIVTRSAFAVDLTAGGASTLSEIVPVTSIDFTARKTGRVQSIPLAPPVAACVDRLRRSSTSDHLFPTLCTATAKDPENGRRARHRREEMKARFERIGLLAEHFPKPCQSARRACNELLEGIRGGIGEFVLGHSLRGVNARNYRDPAPLVRAVVNRVPWPPIVYEFGNFPLPTR